MYTYRKPIVILFLIFNSLMAAGQVGYKIANKKTPAHKNVLLSKVFIVPPPDFKPVDFFPLFAKNEDCRIGVEDMGYKNFFEYRSSYTAENMEAAGLKIVENKEITFQGYPGFIMHTTDVTGQYNYYHLIFGDSTFTVNIFGDANDKTIFKNIQTAIKNAVYDKNFKVDYMLAARQTLDESVTRLKLIKPHALQSGYLYVNNGVLAADHFSEPMFMVTHKKYYQSKTLEEIAEQQKFVLLGRIHNLELDSLDYEFTGKVNGYDVYENAGYDASWGIKTLLYTFVATDHKTVIIITAHSRNKFKEDLEEFKKLSRTLKIKESSY